LIITDKKEHFLVLTKQDYLVWSLFCSDDGLITIKLHCW
jgi:hypothetical protein